MIDPPELVGDCVDKYKDSNELIDRLIEESEKHPDLLFGDAVREIVKLQKANNKLAKVSFEKMFEKNHTISELTTLLERMHSLIYVMARQHTWDEMSVEEKMGDLEYAWDTMVNNSRTLLKIIEEYEQS